MQTATDGMPQRLYGQSFVVHQTGTMPITSKRGLSRCAFFWGLWGNWCFVQIWKRGKRAPLLRCRWSVRYLQTKTNLGNSTGAQFISHNHTPIWASYFLDFTHLDTRLSWSSSGWVTQTRAEPTSPPLKHIVLPTSANSSLELNLKGLQRPISPF